MKLNHEEEQNKYKRDDSIVRDSEPTVSFKELLKDSIVHKCCMSNKKKGKICI